MKVYLKDIKPEGIEVRYEIPPESVGLTKDDYLRFIKPLSVIARIDRAEDTVLSHTQVRGRYQSFCCRTLVPVERDWSASFLLDFPVTSTTEFIELDEDIRQEVILGLPVRVLCDEELSKEKGERDETSLDEISARGDDRHKTYQPFANLKFKKE